MKYEGTLIKMKTQQAEVIEYHLPLADQLIFINELIGQDIRIKFKGEIYCIKCGRKTKTSFGQGFCYPCFTTAPEADPGIIRPELDMAHLGISRDMEWAKEYSLVEHDVYFAFTGAVKVGVTRSKQVVTRWIDQGATSAIKLAQTPYRNLAGLIELEMKKYYADKTNWRLMLTQNHFAEAELLATKTKAAELFPDKLKPYLVDDNRIINLIYPLLKPPLKVSSLSLEKTNEYQGKLIGAKGQYLLFEDGTVLNIRSHSGYLVEIEF